MAVLALGAGCAGIGPSPLAALHEKQEIANEAGAFVLAFTPGDGESRQVVEQAVQAASPRLARWGRLRVPVRVMILPDHAALEVLANRNGYPWLRAWAR